MIRTVIAIILYLLAACNPIVQEDITIEAVLVRDSTKYCPPYIWFHYEGDFIYQSVTMLDTVIVYQGKPLKIKSLIHYRDSLNGKHSVEDSMISNRDTLWILTY